MIARRCFISTAVFIAVTLLGIDESAGERWSRQISNSEWIPLTNPRASSGRVAQSNVGSGLLPTDTHLPNPIHSLSLPPALQHQYQEQLLQLQKTQESIQKLLLLQQHLRAQQQILQSQTFLPGDYSNAEDEKQELPLSPLGNLQTAPELAPEILVPPHPSSEALPPVYSPQNFIPERPRQAHRTTHNLNGNQELSNLPVQSQVILQHGRGEDINVEDTQEGPHTYVTKHGSQRPGGKRPKQPALVESVGDEEEEVQLVYVPAETLAQRGQPKRGRGRKPYPIRHEQQLRENQENIGQSSLSPVQEAFARQVLEQIRKEHEEKAQFLKEERGKEIARLNEEQKALERKTRLQQEAHQREQDLLRQKESEKKRKELEKLEEMAKQRELERIREAREKQRQEELERRRVAEGRVKEEKRREDEARQREERQKQLELEEQGILETQQEEQLRATSLPHPNAQSTALTREQARRQHLTDNNRLKKIRNRPRQRVNINQEQSVFRDVTTTPSPNQPPLSVYMDSTASKMESVKITDVLRILRDAKTIAVLDNVGPHSPQVFVGPANLNPPYGYAKFDLPYLSSIDHNRVERKVDKLPFFVAPLSFDPPPGYSKIPFPAPHIGSVVVNTLSEASTEPDAPSDEQNPSPTPLIEPNSYSDAEHSGSGASTASYETSATQDFSPESSSPKYESTYSTPSTGSRFKFRQFYDNKPTSMVTATYYGEHPTTKTKPKQYYEQESKLTTQSPEIDTTVSYRQEVSYSSTPSFQEKTAVPHDSSTKQQNLAAQLALINQEFSQQRQSQRYNTPEQYHPQTTAGESYDANDVSPTGPPIGSPQYSLPPELPPISPHLPGLVNSLLDKQERNLPIASTPPTTTTTTTIPTTTTSRASSTTYRPRGRGRNVPTRPRTTQATQATSSRTSTDRTRRPYNRSKSRFSTTTEDYQESPYEPTKAKISETTQKYNSIEHKRPSSRTQKYRNRDRMNSQLGVLNQNQAYENYPTQSDSHDSTSPNAYPSTSGLISSHHQKEIPPSAVNEFTQENYPPTTPTQTENYPPLREITVQHGAPLVTDDYARSQNYPQNHPQEVRYQTAYNQNAGFEQTGLERTPVNGFNYQVGNSESLDQTSAQRPKEYPRYHGKLENANFNLATTEDSRIPHDEEHRYSPIYEVNMAQTHSDYNEQNPFRNVEDGKIQSDTIAIDPNESPIFVPLQQNKKKDYELQLPSTEVPSISEITTTTTTTPTPVIIRQRVRARLGGRTNHDSAIQTRPRGSQDEYVRFSAVSHDSGRSTNHRHREGSRTKIRPRPQSYGSQVQTEGNEYIKIHASQQQRLIATTPSTTTSTTTSASTMEEDVDYGFIRPPSFQPPHSTDNRYQAPVTYRPSFSEVQHVISNDETAVESSPTHVLKNRPKYHQTPNRRPTTRTFTVITTSTTETVPVATAMPDNSAYTVKPKMRPEEQKPTRIRGRIRRPGKKRTTTTTESSLDGNNELPLDENYPRITPQQLAVTAMGQQHLYDENYEVLPQYVPSQNRPAQYYEETGENYPTQEFILNFGNLPEQQREEYDQSQLASTSSRKYSHSNRANPSAGSHSISDIYSAESQWSTKLSKTSFQPSFVSNRVADELKNDRARNHNEQNAENLPEIITAGPEMSSVTLVVSSDYNKNVDSIGNVDMAMDTTGFGKKTNAQVFEENMNEGMAVTSLPTTIIQDRAENEREASTETRDWTRGKEENLRERINNTVKKTADPLTIRKNGTRRRRVRVRVRPAVDDFVTAESQHYNTALNSLVQDQSKYNSMRESRFPTDNPYLTTITASDATTTEATHKSLLQGFLEEMLKNDEISIPTRVTSITTELPDWTISTPITTPYDVSDNGEVTTLGQNNTPIDTTLIPDIDTERTTMTTEISVESNNEAQKETPAPYEEVSHPSQDEIKERDAINAENHWDKNLREEQAKQNDLKNVRTFSQSYKLPLDYPDNSETSKEVQDSTASFTDYSTVNEEIQKLSAIINQEKEHIMTLKKQEENVQRNEAHPKNHRTKWSEVRYPSLFNKSQATLKLHSTTTIPGVVTRNDGDTSVKTLSDYVKAIFDSMKSAEEEEGQEEEIAKVIETKNQATVDNIADHTRHHNINPLYELNSQKPEETDEKVDVTDFSRDVSTTRRDNDEDSTTMSEKARIIPETTTNESTTSETTTMIPDSTMNTMASSEQSAITEPSTTTSTTIATSIRRTIGNAVRPNSTETVPGRVLRTSTTTKVSHMTEICYRGRCVMTRPKTKDATR